MKDKNTIGNKIKQLREDRGLKIEELAERANLNLTLIEEIEDCKVVPSLTPLVKIARSLGVRLGTFLDDSPLNDPVIVKKDNNDRVIYFSGEEDQTNRSSLEFHSLAAGKVDRHMEPFVINVDVQDDLSKKLSSHEGEEFIYVLKGEIELIYGKDNYIVSEGDSMYYNSIVPHHLHAHKENAQILAVLYTPI